MILIEIISGLKESNYWKPVSLEFQREWRHLLTEKTKCSQRRENVVDTPYVKDTN